MFGNPETTTGGRALKFYASVRLDVRRGETLKQSGEMVGNHTKVKVVVRIRLLRRLNRQSLTLCSEPKFPEKERDPRPGGRVLSGKQKVVHGIPIREKRSVRDVRECKGIS